MGIVQRAVLGAVECVQLSLTMAVVVIVAMVVFVSSDGIGEGDFVRRKADGDLRSLERSLAQYCSISIHCSIDMTAARCVMQD